MTTKSQIDNECKERQTEMLVKVDKAVQQHPLLCLKVELEVRLNGSMIVRDRDKRNDVALVGFAAMKDEQDSDSYHREEVMCLIDQNQKLSFVEPFNEQAFLEHIHSYLGAS